VSQFVLDDTITMAWCFMDEATEFTENLLSRLSDLADRALVPALWLYEVVNVVELAVRKGRITKEKVDTFLEILADLPIEIENPTRPCPITLNSY
jgi:predicted nucleic acid-binding protein